MVRSSSPQGRFNEAVHLDLQVLVAIEPYGKHLIYDFGPLVHVHLGMAGVWFQSDGPPRPTVRWRLSAGSVTWDLVAPNRCELYTQEQRIALFDRLGADPLRRDADVELAFIRLQRSKLPIGAALLDQRIIAGVGNVIRSELLFEFGIDPLTPASAIERSLFDAIWRRLVSVMRVSAAKGRIVFAGAPRGGRYVYKLDVCPRCGADVLRRNIGGRTAYSCAVCQS